MHPFTLFCQFMFTNHDYASKIVPTATQLAGITSQRCTSRSTAPASHFRVALACLGDWMRLDVMSAHQYKDDRKCMTQH
jgi:hypothetical protein